MEDAASPEGERTTVAGRIEIAVAAAAGAPCLDTGTAAWTYADLWSRSGRVAARLARCGLEPGDRVASMVAKSPDAVAAYLGCLRAGGVYLPLNPTYSDREAGFILEDADPTVLIASPDRADALGVAMPTSGTVLTLAPQHQGQGQEQSQDSLFAGSARSTAFDPVRLGSDDPAAILYTSGTTGKPKGVVLSHGNLVSNADALVDAWRFTAEDVLIHALPIFHVHGLFVALHCALFTGASMRFLERFDVDIVLDRLPGATTMMGVPTFYSRLLGDRGFDREACRTMRLFTSGSAPLSPEIHQAFEARTGHVILERYGMTEAGMITSNPYDGDRVAGSVGFPLPGVETRVMGADQPVPDGSVGELEVRGPNVFTRYWRRPDAETEAFTDDGFLRTGDLVRRDPDGRHWIVGRAKDLVISGGMNVYPAEVENVLDAIDGVAESAIIGVPHADLGEAVVGVVVAGTAAGDVDETSILSALRATIAGYKRPKRIVFVDALPRNVMGKVRKNELRARFADCLAR